jgi:hypothetical protein
VFTGTFRVASSQYFLSTVHFSVDGLHAFYNIAQPSGRQIQPILYNIGLKESGKEQRPSCDIRSVAISQPASLHDRAIYNHLQKTHEHNLNRNDGGLIIQPPLSLADKYRNPGNEHDNAQHT